jgi:phospho-N-acetylmuramoyl-pentapeptide-transferase
VAKKEKRKRVAVFIMNGMWTMAAALISFLITVLSGKKIIAFLHRVKYGQTILEIGPSWHKQKQGTPTMGGIMFILGIVISTAACIPLYYFTSGIQGLKVTETPFMVLKIYAGLIMAVLYGLIGFLDDYIKVVKKQNKGLDPKQKLILQFAVAGLYLMVLCIAAKLFGATGLTVISFPFFYNIDFGILFWIMAAIVIVGIVNAVNLTDGVDGLNSSITFFVGIFMMIIASMFGMFGLSIEAAALVGGCLGFLIWNFHPAKVFMGDTGSLFLGGMVCSLGFGMKQYFILILLCLPYIFEMFSVILQVTYFKITKGKRLFKMSPIHHHFEMLGWSEVKICVIFSLFTVFLGILSFVLALFTYLP